MMRKLEQCVKLEGLLVFELFRVIRLIRGSFLYILRNDPRITRNTRSAELTFEQSPEFLLRKRQRFRFAHCGRERR